MKGGAGASINIPADLKPRVRFSTPTSEVLQIHCKKLKDRITPHMNLYESEGSKRTQSSQSLNSFYNTALSGSDISFRQQRGGREGVRE